MSRVALRILRFLLLILILALLVAAGTALVRRKQEKLAKAPKYDLGPTPVHVAAARKGDLLQRQNYLSVVEPERTAVISARLTATIEEIACDEGDAVAANQVLLRLDDREIRDDIAGVEASIKQARADLAGNIATIASLGKSLDYWTREAERDRTLAAKGDIPASQAEGTADKANAFSGQLDAARKRSDAIGHQIESLKKRQDQLETRLSYCVIRSPFKGIVTSRVVDPGDLAAPGKKLLVVEDRSRLKLAFDVPQLDLPRVKEGLPVGFCVGTDSRAAKLSHMYPSLDLARMMRAEVNLDGPMADGCSCGAYMPLWVELGKLENAILIPAAALIEGSGGEEQVFVVRKNKLEARKVEVLASGANEVAVKGVDPGELVVTSTFLGWAKLSGGLEVEAVR